MPKRTNNKPKLKNKAKQKKVRAYSLPENFADFYTAEETSTYGDNGKKKSYLHYYKNEEPYIRLLKGNCVEILNQARENSVDMIFADPPYFLSNGGISCHAGKMVSLNKDKLHKLPLFC